MQTCSTYVEGETKDAYRVLVGRLRKEDHVEDPSVGGKIIIKWILEKWDGWTRTRSIWLRIETGGRLL